MLPLHEKELGMKTNVLTFSVLGKKIGLISTNSFLGSSFYSIK